jgi:hypothetical protein
VSFAISPATFAISLATSAIQIGTVLSRFRQFFSKNR